MKPFPPIAVLLSFSALTLAPAAAEAARSSAPQAVASALQALPPAEVPAAEVVPAGPSAPAPAPNATAFDDEDLLARWQDAPDEPAIAEEIDKDSAEIEAVRQAEEAAAVPDDATAGQGRIDLIPELDVGLAELQARYDIPIDVNAAVVAYIRFFQSPNTRAHFAKWLSRSHKYLERYRAILREEGLPEDTVYLAMIESGFGNFAYSRARASGPWQFIASTGKHFGLRQDFWVDERRDPEKSAYAAARYLKELRGQTGDWRLAWAGYNTGVGRIRKAQRNGYADFWEMADAGRKVLHPETKGYVPKLMAAAIIAKHPEAFGFSPDDIEPQRWTEYQEVEIPSATLLSVVAEAADVSERALIDLNPELRRACTPPRPYKLKIPVEAAERFAAAWPSIRKKVRLTFAGHTVRRGDTLSGIAHAHRVPIQGIVEMNNLRNARKLRIGQELMIPKPVRGGALVASAEPVREPAVRKGGVHARAATPARMTDRARATHRVKAGDTLWSISRSFGVGVQELARWNGIKNPSRHKLMVGARLVVYR
jgi:membrane-bound lytic murein transglycosylase D